MQLDNECPIGMILGSRDLSCTSRREEHRAQGIVGGVERLAPLGVSFRDERSLVSFHSNLATLEKERISVVDGEGRQ